MKGVLDKQVGNIEYGSGIQMREQVDQHVDLLATRSRNRAWLRRQLR
jgi:hypothetical protein